MKSKVEFLESFLGKSQYNASNGEALFYCCFCHHRKRKLSVNVNTDKFQCWVCGEAGRTLYRLVREAGTKDHLIVFDRNYKKKSKKEENKEEISFKIEWPEKYVPLFQNDSILGRKAISYLKDERGLSDVDILKYKIGLSVTDSFGEQLVFPSFDAFGQLNYYVKKSLYTGRYFYPTHPKNYRNEIIINEINVDWTAPLVLVEGFLDAIKTERTNVVPLLGSNLSMSSKLARKIIENNTELYFALDPDVYEKSIKLMKSFTRAGNTCYHVDVSPYKDVGELPRGTFEYYVNGSFVMGETRSIMERMRIACLK